MKDRSPLTPAETVKHARLARIARAEAHVSRLKKFLREIDEKEMNGEEIAHAVAALTDLEKAFDEFRLEYMELFERYKNSTKRRAGDRWY